MHIQVISLIQTKSILLAIQETITKEDLYIEVQRGVKNLH